MAVDSKGKPVKAGRIADVRRVKNQKPKLNAASEYIHIRIQEEDKTEHHLLFTANELKRAKARAAKNPEDLPPVSILRDLLD